MITAVAAGLNAAMYPEFKLYLNSFYIAASLTKGLIMDVVDGFILMKLSDAS